MAKDEVDVDRDTPAWDLPPDTSSALDWMGVGFVSLDESWRMTRVNDAASTILGSPPEDLVGRDLWETFPGARELEFGRAYESVMTTREPLSFDAFYPGLGVWFELRVRPIPDGIACYFLDITARKAAEQSLAAAAQRSAFMADAMESLAATLDVTSNAEQLQRLAVPRLCDWASVTVVDDDGETVCVVDSTGVLPPELAGRPPTVLPMTARGRTIGVLTAYSERPWTAEQLDIARDVVARAAAAIDNSLTFERAELARERAQVAGRWLSLQARVSEVLSDISDPDAAVGQLAQLVVPQLGDWCLVTVMDDDGTLRDVGYAHRDPAVLPTLAAYSARRSTSMTDQAPRSIVMRTGEPLVLAHMGDDALAAAQPDPSTLALLRALAPGGVAVIPFVARQRVLGVLSVVTSRERGPHTIDEVSNALEVGRRAGPVLETARAARHAQRLAESVQRSVLAIPPPPPGLQIATRYRPANLEHEVGGDWYDTFTTADGSTVVTIGDVMGHDVAAIASMAQLRTFMQACAWTVQHSPAEVLTATDRAGFGLGRRTFATALTADLAPPAPDGSVQVRWSNAGHLPAVFIDPAGEVRLLRESPMDPPLGVSPTVVRHDQTAVLQPGSVVLLYTDGLIERRDRDIDEGLAQLLSLLREAPGQDLDALLDKLLVNLVGDSGTDDVALIAVRIVDRGDHGLGPRSADRQVFALPDDLTAAAVARAHVRGCCAQLTEDQLNDAVLLTSELVGNALRHGSPPAELSIDTRAGAVTIGVSDRSPVVPDSRPSEPDPHKGSGRGLLIVQTLSTAWGVTPRQEGKTVWFTLG